jgi:hypothetical protein
MADLSSKTSANSAEYDDDYWWVEQGILAERRTFSGETDMLVDWKLRIEWQARGLPHVHVLLIFDISATAAEL